MTSSSWRCTGASREREGRHDVIRKKLVKSAVANLQNMHSDAHINVDELKIKKINVDNGPVLKRFRPRSQGRAYRILKRMCHITIIVSN